MALYYIGAFMAVRALPSAFDRARSAEKDFDVLRRTGGSEGPRILFVGGNPGVARFYAAAAQELADATRGDVAVLGLRGFVDGRRVSRGWWGDATRWALSRPRGPFSVDEQIAHVATQIDGESALAESQGRRLVVVGHSAGRCRNSRGTDRRFDTRAIDATLVDFTTGIGGYFALKAQRDVPVICVTPYLENREADPAFVKLRRLVTSPLAPVLASALASVATLLGIVPKVVRRRLLRAAGATAGMDRVHEDVTAETMCGFGNVVTMLGLARDEMRALAKPFDGPYPAGLVLFDDPPDVWCAAKGPLVDRAREAGAVIRTASAPHAFGTRTDARRRVVATIAELVAEVAAPTTTTPS